jgi:HPr kinase/phosphorylase
MITSENLTLETLVDSVGKAAELRLVSGSSRLHSRIDSPELNRPGLALAGFLEVFEPNRIQILGNTEISYLKSLDGPERARRLDATFSHPIPCLIVTANNEIPIEVKEVASRHEIPLLASPQPTTRVMSALHAFLDRVFAPMTNLHGDLLDVFGMGTLIIGESGVGKSECALELIERGHRLAADDQVMVRRLDKERLVGRRFDLLGYNMEVRGLGILNIEMLFGVASVVEEKQIDIVVRLERWNENREYDRLGIDTITHRILDVDVPLYELPVQPGRNISIMVEMAALNQRLKNTGVNPARQLAEQSLTRCMTQSIVTQGLRRND